MVVVPTLDFSTKYPYAKSPSGIEVPVIISVDRNRSVALAAKVDTGADCCVFRREYADELGIHLEEGERKRFATQTGALETRGHP